LLRACLRYGFATAPYCVLAIAMASFGFAAAPLLRACLRYGFATAPCCARAIAVASFGFAIDPIIIYKVVSYVVRLYNPE